MSACTTPTASSQEEYFYIINNLIKDEEFDYATVSEKKIELYNSDNILINEMYFEDYNENIKLSVIRKKESMIYFVQNGAIDDEEGIVFINDRSNELLDGIKNIKRIGGNSYQYRTFE